MNLPNERESFTYPNFGRPFPIFPLNQVILMPGGMYRIHVFEERYREMVADVLDGSGHIAMAVFEGDAWRYEYEGRPPIRPAVCVGQIVYRQRFPDGRYEIILLGLCRARVTNELPPSDGVLYRQAMLEPVEADLEDHDDLQPYRERFAIMLQTEPLTDWSHAEDIVEHIQDHENADTAIIDRLAIEFLSDSEIRYDVLENPNPVERASIIENELVELTTLLKRARRQIHDDLPKGCSWQ